MASTAANRFAAGQYLTYAAPKTGSQAINQGDLLKVSSNLVVPISGVTDVVTAISEETSPVASLGDTLTKISVIRPGPGVLVRLPLKASDAPSFGDQLYISSNVATNPQEVSTSSANSAAKVGICRELATVTGASDGSTLVLVEFLGAAVI